MLSFMSAKEAAEKWNISQRRVSVLCSENRIDGAMMVGNIWIIPSAAQKPTDMHTMRQESSTHDRAKPFVKWAGGKSKLLGKIEQFIECGRPLSKYAEPMVGGGALLFDIVGKFEFKEYYISDDNKELINTYTAIKHEHEAIIHYLEELQKTYISMDDNERKYNYYTVRERFNNLKLNEVNSVEKAALFIFLNRTCFNGLYRVNRRGFFNVPMGSYKNPTICDSENIRAVASALKDVEIVCGDFELSKSFIDKNTFAYIDPPYRPISKTACFTSYGAKDFDDKEQIRLAGYIDEINKAGAKVVLSNSDPKNTDVNDNFFEELYSTYTIEKIEAARAINSKAESRGKINELIIHN